MADAPTDASKATENPAAAAGAPAGEEGGEKQSKKGAKKAEAKAKKEAEKARKAAERQAAEAAAKAAGGGAGGEDLAKDNYGEDIHNLKGKTFSAPAVSLRSIGDEHVGKSIKLRAWVQNSRMQGAKMCFVELREERNWAIQGVIAASAEGKPVSKQMVKWIGGVSLESFVIVEATVQRPLEPVKSCKVQNYELHITKLYVLAPAPEALGLSFAVSNRAIASFDDEDPNAPAAEKAVDEAKDGVAAVSIDGTPSASLSTHLNNPVMHKRAPVQQAIADVRQEARRLFAEYMDSQGFNLFEPPCLIGAASEGGANVFQLPYFDQSACLAQSPQFYKQFEIAGGRKKVYSIGPVFRAENSNTPRHMTEFIGLDFEAQIDDDYHEVLTILEDVLLHIFRNLKERCAEAIEIVRSVYPSEDFLLPEPGKKVRLTFAEAQKLLREEGPEEFRNVSDDEDMSTPQEKAVGKLVREKFNTDFFVIDKFPEAARPFYTMEDPENPKVTRGFDGGQRIHIPSLLEARIRKKGIDPNSPGIKEYVDVFRSAGVPAHGGAGIGLDRIVAFFLNLPTVHLAAYYPRTPKRLVP
ncbi:Aspartate--tRNA ligase [Colletotrichum trifolii]|uniref:Probable aspartate--tRNA ligase, cytoplasmic n=1 Tax=Colletotrichum trifolii TaxID=5466 RepID=A0A4R8RKR4_COLTR|nr:Aspartate--tRNA ligase [Colletotrichum trifolii]